MVDWGVSQTNYNPSGVTGTYLPTGSPPIDLRGGRTPGGTFSAASYVEAARMTVRSAHGHTTVTQTADGTVQVVLTYQAGSATAILLWNVHAANEVARKAGVAPSSGPLEIFDPATREFATIPEAFLTAVPSSDFGAEPGDRAFTFTGGGEIGVVPP